MHNGIGASDSNIKQQQRGNSAVAAYQQTSEKRSDIGVSWP